ncbi:MAG TPA: hypothetical protein VI997_04650 [Candidatus Thermoplasmatota archaeon]|nr:hypothetical protein [Candidatus Thermoplasmatota archaeon]
MDETPRARNERLVRAYLDGELLEGRAFLEERVRHLFPGGFLGALGNLVAHGLWHALGEHEIRKRVREQFGVLASAARDVEAAGLDAALATWSKVGLETEELVHRGNRHHAHWPELEARLAEGFRERVRALAPVLGYAGPATTYEELVRGAYPDRRVPEGIVLHQVAHARVVNDLVRREPDLLRFPKPLLKHLFPLLDDATEWYERRARQEFERIYRQG